MEKEVEINEIKNTINKIINIFACQPQKIYPRIITKNEVDVIVDMDNELIKLSCRTWQDNDYYDFAKELVSRARLDLYIFPYAGEGEHVYISSQVRLCEEPDEEFVLIEKAISSFYEIAKFYEKKRQLEKESADISPGSPMSRLNEEFYSKTEELMLK